jgi:hypothetical protein
MLDVLEHVPNPVAALGHARTLLAPEGRLLVTVPAFPCLWTAHDDFNHHRIRFTARTLVQSAWRARLSAERIRYYFHWLFFAKILVRTKERFFRGAPKMATVPKAKVNRALYRLSYLEQKLTNRIPIPFGSSLAAVFRADDSSAYVDSNSEPPTPKDTA